MRHLKLLQAGESSRDVMELSKDVFRITEANIKLCGEKGDASAFRRSVELFGG